MLRGPAAPAAALGGALTLAVVLGAAHSVLPTPTGLGIMCGFVLVFSRWTTTTGGVAAAVAAAGICADAFVVNTAAVLSWATVDLPWMAAFTAAGVLGLMLRSRLPRPDRARRGRDRSRDPGLHRQ